jgi:hypothetical protein
MLSGLLLLAAGLSYDPTERLSRMTALYDQACLQAFPDDNSVAALMDKWRAHPLTRDEVKVTLNDDPGRGWELDEDGFSASVILEGPPYHACSIRWPMPSAIPDLKDYRAAIARYEEGKGGFAPIKPYETDIKDIHIHAVGDQRQREDGSFDSLFIYDQHITDPKRRAAGETGTMFRFVHQIYTPQQP